MEYKELKDIWNNIDSKINPKSKDELNQLLTAKTRKTINRFIYIISLSVLICIGLLVFLIITTLNRQGDMLYMINNLTLGVITIISFLSLLLSWYKLQNNKYNQPLKDWLEERINLLSGWFTGPYSKLYLFTIPILFILIVLSIHVYFENQSFIDVMKTEESIIGLIAGASIGLYVSYFLAGKIRKYHLKNLENLKEFHGLLCKVS